MQTTEIPECLTRTYKNDRREAARDAGVIHCQGAPCPDNHSETFDGVSQRCCGACIDTAHTNLAEHCYHEAAGIAQFEKALGRILRREAQSIEDTISQRAFWPLTMIDVFNMALQSAIVARSGKLLTPEQHGQLLDAARLQARVVWEIVHPK